jgi:hypothetical protein
VFSSFLNAGKWTKYKNAMILRISDSLLLGGELNSVNFDGLLPTEADGTFGFLDKIFYHTT